MVLLDKVGVTDGEANTVSIIITRVWRVGDYCPYCDSVNSGWTYRWDYWVVGFGGFLFDREVPRDGIIDEILSVY